MSEIREIDPTMSEWPHQLVGIPDPPERLWLRGKGDLRVMLRQAVSIVGSRSATTYGTSVAGNLASDLARSGYTIVSGGAYGIDQAAHRGALAGWGNFDPAGNGAGSIAVLACGADRVYPSAHRDLLDHIARNGGLIVSEQPPGAVPMRTTFLARNRIISAFGQATVVVEAAIRSGSLNTARHAVEQGRPVFGVPGPITSAQSSGVHDLIRNGQARLVTNYEHILEVLNG